MNVKERLKKEYSTCDQYSMSELVSRLEMILEGAEMEKVYGMVQQILARRTAIDWKKIGTAPVWTMSRVLPVEQMLAHDFPTVVDEEFSEIKEKAEYAGEKRYSPQELKEQILNQIAKNIAQTYTEVSIIDVPQSEAMKTLTEEEEMFFISKIQIHGNGIGEEQIGEIKKQIRGDKNYSVNAFVKMIETIPEMDRTAYMESFTEQMKQGSLDTEVESKINEIRQQLRDIDKENAIKILEDIAGRIQGVKKNGQQTVTTETTQADDENELLF